MTPSIHDEPTIINLTPHRVTVRSGDDEWVFESEGTARVRDLSRPSGHLAGVPVRAVRTGGVANLPGPRPGVVFLVSRLLALALPERSDLVFPFGEIRDGEGRIVAVESLGRFVEQPPAINEEGAASPGEVQALGG